MEAQTVQFRCKFKSFTFYIGDTKYRFSDGKFETSKPEVIAMLRKNYRPPMMAEIKPAVVVEHKEPVSVDAPEQTHKHDAENIKKKLKDLSNVNKS